MKYSCCHEDICEECMEYVCHHKYPSLNIYDDVCPLCFNGFDLDNVVYLSKCKHKYHEETHLI